MGSVAMQWVLPCTARAVLQCNGCCHALHELRRLHSHATVRPQALHVWQDTRAMRPPRWSNAPRHTLRDMVVVCQQHALAGIAHRLAVRGRRDGGHAHVGQRVRGLETHLRERAWAMDYASVPSTCQALSA